MELFPDSLHSACGAARPGRTSTPTRTGVGVSLSPHRASLGTAWAVNLLPAPPMAGATFVLLHGAAYGRYLGLIPAGGGLLRRAQCLYNHAEPIQQDIAWEVLAAADGNGNGGVVLRRLDGAGALGASLWIVEPIPARAAPPQLPHHIPNAVPPVLLNRQIQYIRADNFGIFILPSRGEFQFEGRYLDFLIGELAGRLNDAVNNIVLCVRAGVLGRVTPLAVDHCPDHRVSR